MRLTKKYDDNSGYGINNEEPREQHLYIDLNAYEECVFKLGQLEDMEDDLGISFHLLRNILKEGFYEECNEGEYIYIAPENLTLDLKNKCLLREYDDGSLHSSTCYSRYYFKDYRGNWALTKEELGK